MFILEVNQKLVDSCGDFGLATILSIVQKVMGIIQIITPIIMIFSVTFILVKMVSNPEEKKYPHLLRNSIAAGVIVFFIPFIMNYVMHLLDDSYSISACWNLAEESGDKIEWYEDNNGESKKPSKAPVKNKKDDYNFSTE